MAIVNQQPARRCCGFLDSREDVAPMLEMRVGREAEAVGRLADKAIDRAAHRQAHHPGRRRQAAAAAKRTGGARAHPTVALLAVLSSADWLAAPA
jgi:hypothetical protein